MDIAFQMLGMIMEFIVGIINIALIQIIYLYKYVTSSRFREVSAWLYTHYNPQASMCKAIPHTVAYAIVMELVLVAWKKRMLMNYRMDGVLSFYTKMENDWEVVVYV